MQENNANKKNIGLGIVLVCLACLAIPIANAQSDAAILASVRACQSVTGLSERLACYDRVLPPGTATVGTVRTTPAVPPPRATETVSNANTRASRERELEATVAELEEQLELEQIGTVPIAHIVEVQRPSVRTSRLIADDGRVFVESITTSIINWPDTPFDVEVNRSITGTYTIRAIGSDGDRGLGRGYRVALER
jgi:hypothetical protein